MSKLNYCQKTTWMERFVDALTLMCGAEPPLEYCQEWIDNVEVDHAHRLQNWVGMQESTPFWVQNIGLIDAAQVMADTPTEGEGHLD